MGKCIPGGRRGAGNSPSQGGTEANTLELICLLSFYFLLACF